MEHFGICRNADNSSMFINNDLLAAVTPIDIFALPSCVTGNKTPELNKNLLVKKQILYILNHCCPKKIYKSQGNSNCSKFFNGVISFLSIESKSIKLSCINKDSFIIRFKSSNEWLYFV